MGLTWRWSQDRWLSTDGAFLVYDKLEHFLAWFLLMLALGLWRRTDLLPLAAVLFLGGLLWEVKDALLYYKEYGPIGGEGFSWRDLVANTAGLVAAWLILVAVIPDTVADRLSP